MGNHEFCIECGENDFHHGRPCDPARKAAWEERNKPKPKPKRKPKPTMIHREQDIINWGIARNILGPTGEGTKLTQARKTTEELTELFDAIAEEAFGEVPKGRDMARDAIGDIIVTLVMQASLWNLTMEECIEAAWNEIKDRKGRMVNGVFVKEVV